MSQNYDELPIHVDDVTLLTPLFPDITSEEEVKLASALIARNATYNSSASYSLEWWIESVVETRPRLLVIK